MQNLTNALQAALINSGVAKPMTQAEQIWNVVKQDQPCSYKHIAKRTGIKASSVSSILCSMEKRDMVFSRGAKGNGPIGTLKEYLTLLPKYQRLAVSKPTSPTKPATPPAPPAPGVNIDTVHSAQTKPVVRLTRQVVDFDRLTIGEAREMYQRLKEMFG